MKALQTFKASAAATHSVTESDTQDDGTYNKRATYEIYKKYINPT
jgi:hypothetical protein